MLGILNELTVHQESQNLTTNNVIWTQYLNTTTKNKNKHIKPLQEPGIEPGKLSHRSPMRYFYSTETIELRIGVKLSNCFNVTGRNIHKQRQM